MCSEVDGVMTMVETTVQDAVLTAIKKLVIPRVQIAMKSVLASSGRGVDSVVLDSDRRDFSKNIDCLQMTASRWINSHTGLIRTDETRGSITVQGGELSVNDGIFDRQAETHHRR